MGEIKPTSNTKRLKLDNDEDEEEDVDDVDDVEIEGDRQEFIELNEDAIKVSTEASTSTIIDEEKLTQLKASKSLDERQQEFKQMLLERGVSCSYIMLVCTHTANCVC